MTRPLRCWLFGHDWWDGDDSLLDGEVNCTRCDAKITAYGVQG